MNIYQSIILGLILWIATRGFFWWTYVSSWKCPYPNCRFVVAGTPTTSTASSSDIYAVLTTHMRCHPEKKKI